MFILNDSIKTDDISIHVSPHRRISSWHEYMMVNRDRALTKIAPRILNAAEKHRIFFAVGALGLVVLTAYALNRLNNADEAPPAPPIAQSTPRHVAIVRAARFVTKGQVLAAEDMEVATITDSRSEEHTSELQSLMRNSYAVFCLKKKNHK